MSMRLLIVTSLAMVSLVGCGKKFDLSQAGVSSSSSSSADTGLLNYLGTTTSTNTTTNVSKPFGTGMVQLDWGLEDGKLYQSGLGASKLTSFLEGYGQTYCFENTKYLHNCQVARTTIRDVVGSQPVAIQGMQFNFAKQSHNNGQDYKSYAIQGGWVATAELRFDTASGKMVLGNASIENVYNGACDLSDQSGFTVGYFDPTRILTGIYLADEYAVNAAAYTDAYMQAARVWYSGLVPNPQVASASAPAGTCSGIFCWKFQAPNEATTSDIGVTSFLDTEGSSLTSKVSGYFGATKNSPFPRWDSHVIIGFCLNGYKVGQDDYKRPLVHYVIARTHQPKLVFVH